LNDGSVCTFGNNLFGELGINFTTANSKIPVNVLHSLLYNGTNAIDINTNAAHNIILLNGQQIVTFGNNATGQLGNGNIINAYIPQSVASSAT